MCSRLWRCIIEQGNTNFRSGNPKDQPEKEFYNIYTQQEKDNQKFEQIALIAKFEQLFNTKIKISQNGYLTPKR
ncbi:hypothetical protein BpHYR1_017608 [Brachionus plicatilis]|uniref:Uncharacterized protein n=1 Tax=Brachionus plicatilis TaxID=10195 RepID=A0A3M7Q4L2_BRAPC|nr:hypothetical protein BpHYR1_017608 [Brachionus plicatilis]